MISVKADFDRIKRELDASPKKIEANAKRALNRTAKTLRVAARREIQQEIGPKKGAASALNRRIKNRIHPSRLSVFIDFNEQGLGVEHTAKATVRRVRNGGGSVRVNFRGKTLVRAFR
ncbi:MAG: hypothetical protein Q7Q71_15875 [Verrucomicrobiota bacterium JB023]|nr:hypothetical protein [Verrucomicrobiota bacterium JB023]